MSLVAVGSLNALGSHKGDIGCRGCHNTGAPSRCVTGTCLAPFDDVTVSWQRRVEQSNLAGVAMMTFDLLWLNSYLSTVLPRGDLLLSCRAFWRSHSLPKLVTRLLATSTSTELSGPYATMYVCECRLLYGFLCAISTGSAPARNASCTNSSSDFNAIMVNLYRALGRLASRERVSEP